MAVAIRWSLAAVGAILIILGMIWVYAPGTRIFAWDSAGFMGTPVLPTDEWNYYAAGVTWLGLSLLTQWFFLRPRGGLALREESKGRSMRFATFGAGFCAMLITFGLIAALMEIPDLWEEAVFADEFYHPGVYGWMVGLWAVWAMVFYRYLRSRSRILRALIAGTVLELLVAAPVHAACYKRDDCYCTRGSYTALVFGGRVADFEAEEEGRLFEVELGHFGGAREVGFEHLLDLFRERLVGEEGRHLEVETERPIVEVRGANRREIIVDQKCFLMQEAFPVPEDAHARRLRVPEERPRRMPDQPMVGLIRNQEPDIHPAQRSELHRRLDLRVGDEIGRGDPDATARLLQRLDEHQVTRLERIGRAGRKDQRGLIGVRRGLRLPAKLGNLAGRPVPVLRPGELDRLHARAPDPQMRVPPGAVLGILAAVLVAHVEAAHAGDLAVDQHHLAVVAEVHPEVVANSALLRLEAGNGNACLPQRVEHPARFRPATELVEEHEDPHASPRGGHEFLRETPPHLVVAQDVVLHQDVVLRPVDRFEDRLEGRLAVDQQLAPVPAGPRTAREPVEHFHAHAGFGKGRRVPIPLVVEAAQLLLHVIDRGTAGVHVAFELAPPEHPVERQREIGECNQSDRPGDSRLRGAGVEHAVDGRNDAGHVQAGGNPTPKSDFPCRPHRRVTPESR
jgi:hypothetical protein